MTKIYKLQGIANIMVTYFYLSHIGRTTKHSLNKMQNFMLEFVAIPQIAYFVKNLYT